MLKSNYKNNIITNSLIDLGDDLTVEGKGKGRKFISKFIEPGVAHYDEFGDVLITKETLDKFINTMVGCPVIIKHKDITDKNADDERVGVISNVWFNELDGWYYCDGIIWDKQAIDLIKNQNWSVSCTYDFESDREPKTHNGKNIDMEFTNGEFLHLALVDNPRYERASIVMNSKDEEQTTEENSEVENSLTSIFAEAMAEVVTNCLGELKNSFPEHKGRPGKIGGSLPKERDIKHNLTNLLGEEIKGFTGQEAINKVYKERKGHVKDAFYKEGIGNITVCWGDDTCGLKHLEQERLDRHQDPKEIIHSLGKIIKNGHIFKEEDDRWKIRYKDATVIISKELKNEKAVAIITGYKSNKKVSKN